MPRSNTMRRHTQRLFTALAVATVAAAGGSADGRPIRGGAATSVHGGAAGGRNINAGQNFNGNRNVNANRNINANVNRNTNVNVHRDVNVDVDNHWDNHWGNGWHDHPVAAGVAFGTAAAVTAAAIGSVAYSLPPACVSSPYPAGYYYHCGSVWYAPRYAGTSVTYVVVNQP